jgi:hypothetical protein
VESLPQSLAQKRALNAVSLDQIENGPQRPSVLESLCRLDIFVREIRVVEHQDSGNLAIPSEMSGNSHVQLGRVQIGQLIQAQGGLMAVDSLHHLIPIL